MMTPQIVERIRTLHAQGLGTRSIAKDLGLTREMVRYYLDMRLTRARVSSTGHESATFVPAAPDKEAILTWAKENVKPLKHLPKLPVKATAGLLVFSLWDAHLGAYAWKDETGNDWDIGIAEKRVCSAIDDISADVRRYGTYERIVLPIGSDFLHYDNIRYQTATGDHTLDVDSRFAKVYQAGLRCLAHLIETTSLIAKKVDVLYIPGNHDYLVSYTLCVALAQRYPGINFDLTPKPRKYLTYGGVLLGFDHGKDVKVNQYPILMSTEAKHDWASATWREFMIGHKHQRKEQMYNGVTPLNGVLVRTVPSLAAIDYWHFSKGFIGEPIKSAEAYRYDKIGLRGTHVAFARDT